MAYLLRFCTEAKQFMHDGWLREAELRELLSKHGHKQNDWVILEAATNMPRQSGKMRFAVKCFQGERLFCAI